MAVRVEAITLVIRRLFLELHWPDGLEGFLAAWPADGGHLRYVIADDHLVAVSSWDHTGFLPVVEALAERNAILSDGEADTAGDVAVLDQCLGPVHACPWLEFTREPDGVATARLRFGGLVEVVDPPGWSRQESASLQRTDLRLDRERMLKLAEEDGVESWLDLQSGRVLTGRAEPIHREPPREASQDSLPWPEDTV